MSSPTVQLFAAEDSDLGNVGLSLIDAELTEFGSKIVPVVLMSPDFARKIAAQLIELADEVEEALEYD
jgi:hypothetical protein